MKNLYQDTLLRRALSLVIFLFTVLSIDAQVLKGRIIDTFTQEPITGAVVTVKGTNKSYAASVSDADGNFQLDIKQYPTTIIVSFTGYHKEEVEIYEVSSEPIEIALTENTNALEGIVVTAVGKTRLVDEIGSTASVIAPDKLTKAGTSTLINAMSGKASGVRISSPNGEPGSGSNIIIRGANTFIGESQPLIILDGTPISNESTGTTNYAQQSRLNDINSNDIESLQILKGASAAALWGSRAANGVIVITTKNGQKGKKPQISYSFSKSIDWISKRHPIQSIWGQGTGGKWNKNTNFSWGDKISDRSGAEDLIDTKNGYFVAESGKIYYPILQKNSTDTYVDNNFDAVFGLGGYDQHDFSIGGGNDRSNYYISYGGLFQDGILRNAYYNKHNIRLNTAYQFADWIKATAKVTYIHSSSNRIASNGDNTNGAYLALLRTPADFDVRDYKGTYIDAFGQSFANRQRMYRNEIGKNVQPTYNNPLWSTDEQKALQKVNRFIASPQMDITPLKWLNFTLRGGIDFFCQDNDTYFPIGSSSSAYSGGYYEAGTSTRKELNFDFLTRLIHNFSEGAKTTFTLGYSWNDRESRYDGGVVSPFDVGTNLLSSSLASSTEADSWNKNTTHVRSNRAFAIADIELWNQLFVTTTLMDEASSTVNGTYLYPAIDGAWQFTKLFRPSWLSFGKLRASWGQVGTQPAAYKSVTLSNSTNAAFGGSYEVSADKGNSELRPEVKTEWEVGTDLRLFNDKFDVKFTYYSNVIRNLLYNVSLNPSSGYSSIYANGGQMKNHGYEFEATYHVFDTKDFNWNVNLNLSQNKNLVDKLNGTGLLKISSTSVALEGYALGVLYRPGALRNKSGELILDKNGFPKLSKGNVVLGDPNPKWRGAFGMDLRYKAFDISFLFEHSHGGKYLNRTQLTLYGFGVHEDVAKEVTLTEDVKNYNGIVYHAGETVRGNLYDFGAGTVLLDESWYTGLGGGLGINKVHDFYVQDNTWTKLRNITLGYTWKNEWLKRKTNLNSVHFSVTGRDLLLWTNLVGIDPESNNYGVSNAQGMDYFSSPATRSVVFSVQINY